MTLTELRVPKDVERVIEKLTEAGHDAYVVGGAVRDAIRGIDTHNWDVATSATPEQVQELFRRTLYLNRFGTVTVRSGDHDV